MTRETVLLALLALSIVWHTGVAWLLLKAGIRWGESEYLKGHNAGFAEGVEFERGSAG